jgi:hypothetical protein
VTGETERTDANERAVARLRDSAPHLQAVQPAGGVVPGLDGRTVLHSGPPVEWEEMVDPLRGALVGVVLYEGWAETEAEALAYIEGGNVTLAPNSEHSAAAPLAGVTSPSMPVYVVHNESFGETAYTNLNEGLGRTLRFGAYDESVLDRLDWMESTLQPVLQTALDDRGPIALKPLVAEALRRGDECHNRNASATDLFVRELLPSLLSSGLDRGTVTDVLTFITENEHTFLNVSIPAALSTLMAVHGIEGSTLVTRLCANGTDFGVQVSGAGERWFTAPSVRPTGRFDEGYDASDAAPVLGDSLATEATGLGGFALACAPAISDYLGISALDCREATERMYEITLTENDRYRVPAMDGRGTPTGIDAKLVAETGIQPVFNAGMAHRERGVGQVGAGLGRVPVKPFERAWEHVRAD